MKNLNQKISTYELKEMQAFSLDIKIKMSLDRIQEWYKYWEGKVYVAFSGGKDSTVLLNLVRSIYPDVPGVFCNTGLEYPEILSFVKTLDNITWLRPKMPFHKVIEKYGYPVISKKNSMIISRYNNTDSMLQRYLRKYGGFHPSTQKWQNQGVLPKKWHFLLNAPFKISEMCCEKLKKEPFRKLYKNPFIGIMAIESHYRKMTYIVRGCNSYNNKSASSWPLAIWTTKDIWQYIRQNNIQYSKIYDMGYDRTGCMFCMFGVHMEKYPNRFQRMKYTHPKHWNYCINKLRIGKVLNYIKVPYNDPKLMPYNLYL